MAAWGYEFYLLVLKVYSYPRAAMKYPLCTRVYIFICFVFLVQYLDVTRSFLPLPVFEKVAL